MKSIIKYIASFASGTIIGLLGGKAIFEKKAQRRADEAIASVKEMFTVPKPKKKPEEEKQNEAVKKEDTKEESHEEGDSAKAAAQRNRNKPPIVDYTQFYGTKEPEEPTQPVYSSGRARVIDVDKFGENEDYKVLSCTYYSDCVLAEDVSEKVIDDREHVVGLANLQQFDDEDTDVIYVVNDDLKAYYEIARDMRRYTDVTKGKDD